MKKTPVILCMLAWVAAGAFGQAIDFTLANTTGRSITTLEISPWGEEAWTDDILVSGPVASGQTIEVVLDPDVEARLLSLGATWYDLLFVLDTGESLVFGRIDLEDITEITLASGPRGEPLPVSTMRPPPQSPVPRPR